MGKSFALVAFVMALSGYVHSDSARSKKFVLDTELHGRVSVDYKQT